MGRLGSEVGRRAFLLAGPATRLAIGAGYLLAPDGMASARLAPDAEHLPAARLFVRGFGGHQVITGGLGLAALWRGQVVREALTLGVLVDAFDVASALLEIRTRATADRMLVGGIVLSGTGIAWGLLARRSC